VCDLAHVAPGCLDDVQTYVINSSKVAFLKRRPQPRAPKGASGAARCGVCARHLQDLTEYCSLQCKLDAVAAGGAAVAAAALPPITPASAGGRYRGGAPAWPRAGAASGASPSASGEATADWPRARRSPGTPPADAARGGARAAPPPGASEATTGAASDGADSDGYGAASLRRKNRPKRAPLD